MTLLTRPAVEALLAAVPAASLPGMPAGATGWVVQSGQGVLYGTLLELATLGLLEDLPAAAIVDGQLSHPCVKIAPLSAAGLFVREYAHAAVARDGLDVPVHVDPR